MIHAGSVSRCWEGGNGHVGMALGYRPSGLLLGCSPVESLFRSLQPRHLLVKAHGMGWLQAKILVSAEEANSVMHRTCASDGVGAVGCRKFAPRRHGTGAALIGKPLVVTLAREIWDLGTSKEGMELGGAGMEEVVLRGRVARIGRSPVRYR